MNRTSLRLVLSLILLAHPVALLAAPQVKVIRFGEAPGGSSVKLYTLTNASGASVSVMTWGATVVKIIVPDRTGKMADVVLGFDRFDPYPKLSPYFGAIVGRYGNRIAKGRFTLDGKTYQLAINNGPNALHGGIHGFDKQTWRAEILNQDPPTVEFSRVSPDGEENYPGTLTVQVTYTWNNSDELKIGYRATTDKPTVLNLTNHTYFNLADHGTILGHQLYLNADAFTPVDSTLIPTGEIKPVKGTPWDFLTPTEIGSRLEQVGGDPVGYDHNYVLNKGLTSWSTAAEVYEAISGRTMKVLTDQPGIQFYSGNFLDGKVRGKGRVAYPQYGAFCLETQHFPDSPNHAYFPSVVLRPGTTYASTSIYAFGTK